MVANGAKFAESSDAGATPEDCLLVALDKGDAAAAAAILRGSDCLNARVREALADMLDGIPATDKTLRRRYPFRLILCRWPGRTRPRRNVYDLFDATDLAGSVTTLVSKGMLVSAAVAAVAKQNKISEAKVRKARSLYNRRSLFKAGKKAPSTKSRL